jgi:ribosomal-protein-alanine N-acetyltransferase
MTDRVSIVPFTDEHLPAVLAIERRVFTTPWAPSLFRAELDGHSFGRGRTALRDGVVVGYIFFWIVFEELRILNVAVAPEFQGQGIGTALMRTALEEGRQAGCHEAWLEVRPSNDAALRVYARLGFVEHGRRPGYYQDTGEDALLLRLALKPE